MPDPRRGEIWLADLAHTRGAEPSEQCPVLVISENLFNSSAAGLVVVVPLTTQDQQIPFHVPIASPEVGTEQPSYIRCEDIRSIATDRLMARWGAVSAATMADVEYRLRLLLKL